MIAPAWFVSESVHSKTKISNPVTNPTVAWIIVTLITAPEASRRSPAISSIRPMMPRMAATSLPTITPEPW